MKVLMRKKLKKILENKDIFNRGFELKKIDLDDSYPKYIIENKENLKWIRNFGAPDKSNP